jgi:valyl-tRNA synthetase
LELVKSRTRIEGEPSAAQLSALHTLFHATTTLIQLYAPFLPYVCESLNDLFKGDVQGASTVHARGNWPQSADHADPSLNQELGDAVMEIIAGVRKAKSELGVSLRAPILTLSVTPEQKTGTYAGIETLIAPVTEDLKDIAIAGDLRIVSSAPGEGITTLSPNQGLRITLRMDESAAAERPSA